METQEILNKPIGTKELAKLKPATVKIVEIKVVGVGSKDAHKLVCGVKHPDKEEIIHISEVKYESNGKLTISGLWVNLDEDDNIKKGSALANFLGYMKADVPGKLIGQEAETLEGEKGYLCFKGY